MLRELAVRAAQPGWQLGFSHWPRAARILCVPVGMALVPLSFLITSRLLSLWQSVQQSTPAGAAQSGWRWLENLEPDPAGARHRRSLAIYPSGGCTAAPARHY